MILDIEKPAAGGRMLARHDGQVILVSGAIPGERVVARLERTGKGVAFVETIDVLAPSPDRRPVAGEPSCGGNVFAHIDYPRQLTLKGQVVQDAFARIGRLPIEPPVIAGSPERGYRMRARLHVQGTRIGFLVANTHRLCDATATGQLSDATNEWIRRTQDVLRGAGLTGAIGLELAENVSGDQRACHVELGTGGEARPYAAIAEGLIGLSAGDDRHASVTLAGTTAVTDTLQVGDGAPLLLRRDVRAFFQGNRFLMGELVRRVTALVPDGPVVDLYAGVGLFGLALARMGRRAIALVEGDRVSGADLERNARPFADRVTVARSSVEAFLASARGRAIARATVIVDPPRTGLSRQALERLVSGRPRRLVYVSCDVATLARDVRLLSDAGYTLDGLSGLDLFPNTAHVETVALLVAR